MPNRSLLVAAIAVAISGPAAAIYDRPMVSRLAHEAIDLDEDGDGTWAITRKGKDHWGKRWGKDDD